MAICNNIHDLCPKIQFADLTQQNILLKVNEIFPFDIFTLWFISNYSYLMSTYSQTSVGRLRKLKKVITAEVDKNSVSFCNASTDSVFSIFDTLLKLPSINSNEIF